MVLVRRTLDRRNLRVGNAKRHQRVVRAGVLVALAPQFEVRAWMARSRRSRFARSF
jgi:hypothetical protein